MEGVLHSINVSDGGVPKLPRNDAAVRRSGLEVGEVVLQLTRHAAPCQNIAGSFSDGRVVRVSEKVHPGWSRFYACVLKEGTLRVGDRVHLIL